MPICRQCGIENSGASRFCGMCGAPLYDLPVAKKTDLYAVLALAFAGSGALCILIPLATILMSVVAVILAAVSVYNVRNNPETLTGNWLAVAAFFGALLVMYIAFSVMSTP